MEIRKENNMIEDQIITKKLSSGMKCYIIPKKGYGEKMAAVVVRYGANDLSYTKYAGDKQMDSPMGTAHFIEHRLFAQPWGDAFSAFAENGAQANAFTDFQKTAYYFSCREQFDENMELLLRFVQNPYFQKEPCEQEKKIIASEITMYDDDPGWIVYFNLLKILYHNHPVQYPIAGTVASIEEISHETLKRCYDAFYTPENMSFICVGDIDPETVLANASKWMSPSDNHRLVSCYEKEPEEITGAFCRKEMGLSIPMFQIGFKQKPQTENKTVKKDVAMSMALDILVGESSDFNQTAMQSGLISEPVGFGYFAGDGFSFTSFNGSSNAPEKTAQLLLSEINRLKSEGVTEEAFSRMKKKQMGRMVRSFNSINAICMGQIEASMKNMDLFDRFQILKSLKLDEVQRVLQKEFIESAMALSVVK